ncbi:MAG: TIGR02186 family protein [Rhizobiaceae bacterium]|nr:TIGR02186 family protein [Rhizobiaceae bacterium]
MFRLLSFVLLFVMSVSVAQAKEKLQMGLSVDVVPVGSDFAGQDIVVFGAIESADQAELYRGEYDVLIEVIGDLQEAIVRKKDRISGIWVNAAAREYRDVPSFYSLHSRNPIEDVVDPSVLSSLGIGIKYLKAKPVDRGNIEEFLTQGEFSSALRRKRIENLLFSERADSVDQISPSLFRAAVSLPPNVPIGFHTVKAHLFKDGKKLDEVTQTFEVRKVGFEEWIYNLAHEQSLLYGILCVLLAIFTGWFANVVFRKN